MFPQWAPWLNQPLASQLPTSEDGALEDRVETRVSKWKTTDFLPKDVRTKKICTIVCKVLQNSMVSWHTKIYQDPETPHRLSSLRLVSLLWCSTPLSQARHLLPEPENSNIEWMEMVKQPNFVTTIHSLMHQLNKAFGDLVVFTWHPHPGFRSEIPQLLASAASLGFSDETGAALSSSSGPHDVVVFTSTSTTGRSTNLGFGNQKNAEFWLLEACSPPNPNPWKLPRCTIDRDSPAPFGLPSIMLASTGTPISKNKTKENRSESKTNLFPIYFCRKKYSNILL